MSQTQMDLSNVLPFVDGPSRAEVVANMKAAPLAPTKPPAAPKTIAEMLAESKRIKSRKRG